MNCSDYIKDSFLENIWEKMHNLRTISFLSTVLLFQLYNTGILFEKKNDAPESKINVISIPVLILPPRKLTASDTFKHIVNQFEILNSFKVIKIRLPLKLEHE